MNNEMMMVNKWSIGSIGLLEGESVPVGFSN